MIISKSCYSNNKEENSYCHEITHTELVMTKTEF